jgi:hypothetical protein
MVRTRLLTKRRVLQRIKSHRECDEARNNETLKKKYSSTFGKKYIKRNICFLVVMSDSEVEMSFASRAGARGSNR